MDRGARWTTVYHMYWQMLKDRAFSFFFLENWLLNIHQHIITGIENFQDMGRAREKWFIQSLIASRPLF